MGVTDPNGNNASSETKSGHVNVGFEGFDDPGIVPPKVATEDVSAEAEGVEEDDGIEREQWGNPLEFLMSCISLSVGLGNIWRFPYTAYKNGGGAFLIPYLIVLTFIGRPVYFLEIALGQFSSYGPVKMWGISPFFKGVGYGSAIGTTCILSYYAMLMGSVFELDGEASNISVSQLFFENEKMLEPQVWFEAIGQCFFSLNTGFGPLIMFGSYNGFRQNSYRDAWIVSGLDTFTSLFAGITVFAVLGNLAGELGVDVQDVARGGAGLTFVSFAQGLGTFTVVPQLFSVLFYIMLLTLGVGSGVSLSGTVIAVIHDNNPQWSRPWIVTGVCTGGFLLGIMYTTPGGQFLSDLVDYFGANFVIYLMVMLEAIGVSWVYGINNIIDDFEFMLDRKLGWYWKICWAFIVPVGLGFILIYSLATSERMTYNKLRYPDGVIVFGWLIAGLAFAVIPFYAIKAIRKTKGDTLMEKIKVSFQPTEDWGPKRSKFRKEWLAHKQQKKDQN
ncbi:unnamed protein product [Allacma fusca]|uniref:Transporter n=1 Tax=Allacma fusca TaxID=39272 RepID=A0A8J2KD84_9HEXA|nr:unnamed protein product [Allacma fusca]